MVTRNLKYSQAISEGLVQAMERDPSIFVTGIAVDYPSGIFGTTADALNRFGPARVFDAPAMENALAGIAIGAAAVGMRPVIVHPRADFMFLAMDQLINLAAKWKYMYGGNAGSVPVVVRAVIGRGWGQGATHSQSIQSVLAHFPGLAVAMPATPRDAKGMIVGALRAEHPTVILEYRSLYDLQDEVPTDCYATEFGHARVARTGNDLTIVATSQMVEEAMVAAAALSAENIDVEVVDLRWIRPLDEQTVLDSVRKTGRLIVADTSWQLCGVASEVAALAAEKAFAALKAPVRRVTLPDCPAPVSLSLEKAFYPKASTLAALASAMIHGVSDRRFVDIDVADGFKGPY